MSNMDSTIFNGKSVEKELTLAFDAGDDVIANLRRAMQENNIREATAVNAEGTLKEATIQYFIHNKFQSTELRNGRIVSCSGRFMNLGEGVYGDLHVGFMLGMQMWDGTLVKAIANDGFSLKMRFYQKVSEVNASGIGAVKE